MALLERVAALLRADVDELVRKSQNPVRALAQVILDLENQSLQVKTQLAMAVADHHVLEMKRRELFNSVEEWKRKAELALRLGNQEAARKSVERALATRDLTGMFDEQIAEQAIHGETLKNAFEKLQTKLAATRPKLELIKAQKRRTHAGPADSEFTTMNAAATSDTQFQDREQEIERILQELRSDIGT